MAMRTNTRLFKKLLGLTEVCFPKTAQGNSKRAHLRCVGSCGALAARKTSLPLIPASTTFIPDRGFINLAASISPRRIEYTECRTLGYTPEQMYKVVASVDQYQQFVPWCKKSRFVRARNGDVRAELQIGFPPIVERYVSEVTFVPNHQVRAVCTDGTLFSHLETVWRFSPGDAHVPHSCKVDFFVSFEFKSLLHSQLASVFFDEVVKQMVSAFESRAATLYRSRPEISLRSRSAA